MMQDDLRRARRRALRAAQVATIGLALAVTPACGDTGGGDDDAGAGTDAFVATVDSGGGGDDASTLMRDGSTDSDAATVADASTASDGATGDDGGSARDAAAMVDAFVATDAGCTDFPPTTEECCNLTPGGFWTDEGCIVAVPGPFVPPSMSA